MQMTLDRMIREASLRRKHTISDLSDEKKMRNISTKFIGCERTWHLQEINKKTACVCGA